MVGRFGKNNSREIWTNVEFCRDVIGYAESYIFAREL